MFKDNSIIIFGQGKFQKDFECIFNVDAKYYITPIPTPDTYGVDALGLGSPQRNWFYICTTGADA